MNRDLKTIHDNVFGRTGYKMVHLVAKEQGSCPKIYNNTYIQDLGVKPGRYGGNKIAEPDYTLHMMNMSGTRSKSFSEKKTLPCLSFITETENTPVISVCIFC